MNFAEFRPWFDQRFSLLLTQKIQTFSAYSASVDVHTIASYAHELGVGGKRFRPYLVAFASKLSYDELERHATLLYAVELLHLFALIHDDIMDVAQTRHGVECAQTVFGKKYGEHTGNAVAILLDDIVFAWAYECLLEYGGLFPALQPAITKEFTRLVREVTHGQLLDVLSPVQAPLTHEDIVQKMILKTARYSFVQPLRLGATIAGTCQELDAFIEQFGVAVGVGFQLQDDLLDVTATEQSGKSAFVDIETGQQTSISWYMRTRADEAYREKFNTLFGNKLSTEDRATLAHMLTESGAITYTQGLIRDYFKTATDALAHYISTDERAPWENLMALILERKK